ncbi:cytochrome c oxidase subunit VIa-domain-containing protein [Dipodascopsis tothii]|uniref:cytochrome c oxidase subunit VIa-domain-containing protein n=1 Tax=Dipodascopsis tothii TaxID=44089 RepID=UPI0034CD8009
MASRLFSRAVTARLAAPRVARPAVRGYATESEQFMKADPVEAKKFLDELEGQRHHAAGTSSFWLKVTFYLAVPISAVAVARSYIEEKAHLEHLAHAERPSDDELPPEYEYQNIRAKPYWWGDGDKSLFWNDKYNHHRQA